MGLKTACSFVLAAATLVGCQKKMLDADHKKCKFIMHADFYTQRDDIEEPEVFRSGSYGARVIYRHRNVQDRALEIRTYDNNQDGIITLREATGYFITQDCRETCISETINFNRARNQWTRRLYDYSKDNEIMLEKGWRGMDGRPGDPILEFLNPQSDYYLVRDSLMANTGPN